MADNVKDVTQTSTPLPQQTTADDNRRRTRSQTRNGGITPPAPIIEPRGRKRASNQSQAGSGGKRGKKPAQETTPAPNTAAATTTTTTTTTTTEPVDAPTSGKEAEEHSKQAENQDLSNKQQAVDDTSVVTSKAHELKKDDVKMETAEGVKLHTEDEVKNSAKGNEAQEKEADKEGTQTTAAAATTTATTTEPVDAQKSAKEAEEHPKQAENQDLSNKQQAVDDTSVVTSKARESKKDDVKMETAEGVKLHSGDEVKNSTKGNEAQEKDAGKEGAQDACKLVKGPEPKAAGLQEEVKGASGEKAANLEKKNVEEVEKREEAPTELADKPKTSLENSCTLPKKAEPEASDESKKEFPSSVAATTSSSSAKEGEKVAIDAEVKGEKLTQAVENAPQIISRL